METKIENCKDPFFTNKNLLMIAVIVSVVTGGNLWLHNNDPALGYARYTGVGFTFDYNLLMDLQVSGFGGGSLQSQVAQSRLCFRVTSSSNMESSG